MGSRIIRVAAVDDHPAVVEALRRAVNAQPEMVFVGAAQTSEQTIVLLQRTDVNVVVLDLSLGDVHGLDLVRRVHGDFPEVRIVLFSMYAERVYAERAIRSGASGYVMKTEPIRSVIEAIRIAHDGNVYLSQRMAADIMGTMTSDRRTWGGFALDDLTERELTVLKMLGEGCSAEEIARRLNLSRKTVETHRRHAKEKLGLRSVGELLQYAIRWAREH